ncbi:sigma-70 family RNA polymerase sigma factor [Saccharopolyspora sp. NPDC050389]|uniref:sigma-70 family RNA polymerase sigma factor n=1 Tax=Saccharopolyspora sp. NPDC050389 TaxID=3155516 RepID=UPI0033E11AE9
MATVPAEVQGPSDGELLEEVRSGSSAAYAQLYERHVGAAYNMARQVAKSPAEADDLVSEAFAKVLDTLRDGRGPNTAFRAYLLTALRHTAYDRTRRERKVQLADDVAEVSGADVSVPFTDTAVAGLERTLAAQAFTRLPERWQTVLWHIEIEGQTPAQVAPLLGLTPNGVSALAYRAREGLRQAYLQVHLGQLDAAEAGVEQCRAAVDRLGAWTRGGLSKRETAQVETHLDGCDRCRALAAELADVNGALRVIIAPLVLGGSVTGYLALSSSGGAAAGAAVAAGSASGAAGAASAAPRQAITAGAATAVLAAAVAIALASGTDQSVPVAAAAPPPPAAVQPPPAPEPPAAQPPAPPTPQPPVPQPAPQPAPPPPAPPAATPVLNASGPAEPIQLVAGGDPVALPIMVNNSGSGPSEPVISTLKLPPGVSARLPNATRSGPASTSPQSWVASSTPVRAQAPDAPSVSCTNGSGSITCTTDRGLRPGESFVFDYRIQADESSTGGEITANISAGTEIQLQLPTVPVVVQPPTPVDGVDVRTSSWNAGGLRLCDGHDTPGHVPWLCSRVTIDVRNTGTSTGRAEAVAKLPPGVQAVGLSPMCDFEPGRIRCAAELAPGKSFHSEAWVTALPGFPWPLNPHPVGLLATEPSGADPVPAGPADGWIIREVTIPVAAELGSADDSDPVTVRLWFPWLPTPPEPEPPAPTTTSTPPECPWPPHQGWGERPPWDWGDRPPWRPAHCWWPWPVNAPLPDSQTPTSTTTTPPTSSTTTTPPTTTPPTTSTPPSSTAPPTSSSETPSSTAPPMSSSETPSSTAPPTSTSSTGSTSQPHRPR